ncbi:MAG: ABC transporter substrate-binding protein [Paracoccaceae bacterium]
MTPRKTGRFLLTSAMLLALATAAQAQTLRVGIATGPTSLDPHFHNLGPNNAAMRNVYDRLIHMDANMRLQPGLAVSWTPLDNTSWQINLREGVTFHDGTPFGAEDVAFTISRIPLVPNSPSALTRFVSRISAVEVVDSHTLILRTTNPSPLLPNDLAQFSILSLETTEAYLAANPGIAPSITEIDSSHFNSGALAIGTGPFRLVSWAPGDPMVLSANSDYWGGAPAFADAVVRPIPNDAARLAALLSGDVDLIDGLPTADIASTRANSAFNVFETPSNLAVYLHMDSDREISPFVRGLDGSEIANPLRDVRVRQAMSMALNREAIARVIMDGAATPAGQMLAPGFAGASDTLAATAFDPDGARALLAEAGYPDGFAITLNGPNDRYVNDERIAQAVAQNLSRIGIRTEVSVEPASTYFGAATRLEYSVMLLGWGSSTGEQGSTLDSLLRTHNSELGHGGANRGRFSDARFDEMIGAAMQVLDETERNAQVAAAAEYVIGERFGVIPIHFQMNFWAARQGITMSPRADNYTVLSEIGTR